MPPPEAGSKHERLEACLAQLADEDLLPVAQRFLDSDKVFIGRAERFALEDALWAAGPVVEIPGRVRRELARTVGLELLVHRPERFGWLL
ncbi:hypothetical protein [Kitasatospora sp. NPDC091207]|uniref:hypothetical protein n=1 Tax=Kitasatospora sp. NPDC091207 TaxID=3364083 RepID=UPI0037F4C6D7